jgi:hypothetical protein|nr:MAG TPA: hypothetical protein [Caudoviricetes sp.]
MKTKIQLRDFSFEKISYGRYKVIYTSPLSSTRFSVLVKQWTTVTDDMPLIDATKNCDKPKVKDLEALKWLCKNK